MKKYARVINGICACTESYKYAMRIGLKNYYDYHWPINNYVYRVVEYLRPLSVSGILVYAIQSFDGKHQYLITAAGVEIFEAENDDEVKLLLELEKL